jgi:hypothetical protein
MIRYLKVIGILSFVSLISFFLAGCPAPGGDGGITTYSGTVIDFVTGQPVPGATVAFGAYSATSASDGTFSINFGQQTGTLAGDFSVYATGYQFFYASSVTLNAASNLKQTLRLTSLAAYTTTHTVSGKIFKPDGATEASNQQVRIMFFNASGGFSDNTFNYVSGGYSIQTPTFGADCLVGIIAESDNFVAMKDKVDLSGLSTTSVNLTQPPSPTSVTVNGTSGNACMLTLSSPYGYVPGIPDGTPLTASSITVQVTNPYNYQGYWGQESSSSNSPTAGNQTDCISTSGLAAITSSVTLPSLPSGGPTSVPSASPLSYSSGTLSLASVAGANGYGFQITGYGQISSTSAAVSLPSWMKSLLSGKSIPVSVQPQYTSLSFDLSFAGNLTGVWGHTLLPNFQFVVVHPSTGQYQTTIAFP